MVWHFDNLKAPTLTFDGNVLFSYAYIIKNHFVHSKGTLLLFSKIKYDLHGFGNHNQCWSNNLMIKYNKEYRPSYNVHYLILNVLKLFIKFIMDHCLADACTSKCFMSLLVLWIPSATSSKLPLKTCKPKLLVTKFFYHHV